MPGGANSPHNIQVLGTAPGVHQNIYLSSHLWSSLLWEPVMSRAGRRFMNSSCALDSIWWFSECQLHSELAGFFSTNWRLQSAKKYYLSGSGSLCWDLPHLDTVLSMLPCSPDAFRGQWPLDVAKWREQVCFNGPRILQNEGNRFVPDY